MATRQSTREATRLKLLRASGELFAERRASQVKATDITERAEVSTGSLYVHFGSKDGALEAVLRHASEALADRIAANWEMHDDAISLLEASSRAIVEMVLEDRASAIVYLREASNHPAIRASLLHTQREALARGQRLGLFRADLALEPTTHALLGLIGGLLTWWLSTEHCAPEELEALLTSTRAALLLPATHEATP